MTIPDIKQWVTDQQPHIEAALKGFVETNTYTANKAGVQQGMDDLCMLAQGMGFSSEVINHTHRLIKDDNHDENATRILLISHMDTVHSPDGDFQHYEPLDDGYVRGPGVADIKGGLVMGLWAMKALREMNSGLDVQMVVSADEEKGSPTIRDWYLGGNIHPHYAVGLEPGFPQGALTPDVPLGVVYHRRGYGAIRFTVKGLQCHSGTPYNGLNAISAMAQKIQQIDALSDRERGMTTNIGVISGGYTPNTVAGNVEVQMSFRFESQEDGDELLAGIKEILETPVMHNADLDIQDETTYEIEAFIPPMEFTDTSQKMIDIVLEEADRLGHNVVPIARGGGSDANYVCASGVPSICGMGAPCQDIHTTDEKIYLPMLFERIVLLINSVQRIGALSAE